MTGPPCAPRYRRWSALASGRGYDPALAGASIAELAVHLVDCIAHGDSSEYGAAAAALEQLYATLHEDVAGFLLSAGFLEDLIHEGESRGVPLGALFSPLGPRAREQWRLSYAYTHKGQRWTNVS